jgi:hypothetical protein
MRRALLLVAALIGLAAPARAQQQVCPLVTVGWSIPYQGQITSVLYDYQATLLYVIFAPNIAHAFSNVPLSVMQAFSMTTNPIPYYNGYVQPSFHELSLANQTNCPLFFEGIQATNSDYNNDYNNDYGPPTAPAVPPRYIWAD